MIICAYCKQEYNSVEEAEKCADECMQIRDSVDEELNKALDRLFGDNDEDT